MNNRFVNARASINRLHSEMTDNVASFCKTCKSREMVDDELVDVVVFMIVHKCCVFVIETIENYQD